MHDGTSLFFGGWVIAAILVALLFVVLVRGGWGRAHDGHDPFVIDGDTLVSERVRIRLHGIDAPEMSQAGGAAARSHLISLIAGGAVRIEPLGTDKYGRMVARVHARCGDLSRLMVRDGYARAAYEADYAGRSARPSGPAQGSGPGPGSPPRPRTGRKALAI